MRGGNSDTDSSWFFCVKNTKKKFVSLLPRIQTKEELENLIGKIMFNKWNEHSKEPLDRKPRL